MIDVTFLYPQAAWLLLLLPLLWWPTPRRRDWRHLALRAGLFACLIGALMQPSLIRRAATPPQVFVLDQREMLGEAGRRTARAALDRVLAAAPVGGRRTLIQLGGGAVPARVDARERLGTASLSQALALALDALPAGSAGAITLIVDPRSTDRHWDTSIAALARRGIAVNTIALDAAPHPAFIADVRTAPARVGETLVVTVDVEGDGADHVLTLWSGGTRVAVSPRFRADGTTPVTLHVPAGKAGFLSLRAILDGRGGFDTVAAVQPPLRLLYLGGRQAGAAQHLQRLLGDGFTVEQRPAAALGGMESVARWPLLFVDDLRAAQFPAAVQRAVAASVAYRGSGLIASGGQAAFAAGGYAYTPLGAMLPVETRQDETLEKPTVALAIVIDSSGSMGGEPLDLAKQIARQTVRKLTPADWVGVVEFYGARQWLVPMQHARDTTDVERAIGRMQAQGSSMLFPALQEAYFGLKDVTARYKHILVISDGGVAEDRYQQLLRHIADDRITVSTAQVGAATDGEESMAAWARIGGGRFYSVPDEFSLVALSFKQPDTKPDPAYRTGAFPVRALPDPLWWDGAAPVIPPLAGYARTTARPGATMLATAGAGDPLLTSWPFGSGRVTALATEPLGAGTRAWQDWAGYGRWLARIAATTARQQPDSDVAIDRRFDRLSVAVQRMGDRAGEVPAIRFLGIDGRVIGTARDVERRAPELFVADLPFAAAQPALVEVQDGDHVARAADRAFSDVSPPDAMPASRRLPLAALARRTGGWHRDDSSTAPGSFARTGGWAATDIWPWLALLALALYLLDISYRRWPSCRLAGIP